ncbi:Translocation and assembly module TamA [Candidatus Kinetoplastibacterium sorsogonicusi]|uniref:Translocation and assembly module TamA n=1 Tax=Candidatus Kinetoplastidibacterium kentomonadis TaxID=1576550 RepID=A0A3S7J983_9PROT|nr:BamA/TamA family outer membrane protein [Candidatus Kinetoplastibacterium sorsogonicusi]AWD32228.1 Translocation and assembly module TamA [Candidatus Kinetoplastibacterium sorsogonicusi]
MNLNITLFFLIFFSIISNAEASCPSFIIKSKIITPDTIKIIENSVNSVAILFKDSKETDLLRYYARNAAISALASDGYFSPIVDLNIYINNEQEIWLFSIDPGDRTIISNIDICFKGAIQNQKFDNRLQILKKNCPLKIGDPFINDNWNKAKSYLLNSISSNNFLLAKIINSYVLINKDDSFASLHIEIDSGPEIFMGPIHFHGFKKIPPKFINNYIRYNEGDEFKQEILNNWQQKLQSLKFFHGAFVYIDNSYIDKYNISKYHSSSKNYNINNLKSLTLPIHISVSEVPTIHMSSSIGIDSNAGIRLESIYKKNIIMGIPTSLSTGFGLDRFRQKIFLDFDLLPNANMSNDSMGILFDRSNSNGLDVKRIAFGFTRSKQETIYSGLSDRKIQYDNRIGSILAHDIVKSKTGNILNLPSLNLTSEWIRRNVDNKYNTRQGSLLSLRCGAGITLNKFHPYCLSKIKLQKWFPIAKYDVITFRSEIGKIWKEHTQIYNDFSFRTGGTRAIRGYSYHSLGSKYENSMEGVSSLAIFSSGYDHYFNKRLGIGIFIDAGDASLSFLDMKFASGYGLGMRFLTPAGPLLFDLAYGHREKKFKLHFSLGISF